MDNKTHHIHDALELFEAQCVLRILCKLVVPLSAIWLIGWLVISWPAIQDDALIHLRYASFLNTKHFVTFDGENRGFGASSLLYVALLAGLRTFTTSPLLSRCVSSLVHALLFLLLMLSYVRNLRTSSLRTRLLILSVILILAAPSSVRWLDDGMETGMSLGLLTILVSQTHRLSLSRRVRLVDYLLSAIIGFVLVFMRIELAVAALFSCVVLIVAPPISNGFYQRLRVLSAQTHFVFGAAIACITIRILMHSFLPDTAVAKSHGFSGFGGSFRAAATVLFGAMLFGAGSMTLWLISAITAMRNAGVNRFATLVANLVFPFVFLLAAVHGQEIQGARYFVWCFWFSICWNLLELRRLEADGHSATNAAACAPAIFILCLLIVLPVESRLMYRVLTTRARTMRSFLATDLAPTLHKQLGVAADVGYISYYSQSNICDLSGLVNGRADALMSREQRLKNCAGEHPTFAFLNTNQVASVATVLNISSWRVCGVFDFGNLREPDRHYLLVAPQIADETCHATGYSIAPESSALTEAKYQ